MIGARSRCWFICTQGLPFFTIWDWNKLTPEWLEQKWDELMQDPEPKYNLDKMWATWWLTYVLKECLMTP